MAVSVVSGWQAKVLFYKHIFKTHIQDQPINILILADQVGGFLWIGKP
jgi:hypothetical protein